jgi:hypothetical protein
MKHRYLPIPWETTFQNAHHHTRVQSVCDFKVSTNSSACLPAILPPPAVTAHYQTMGDMSWDVREDEHILQGRVKLNCSKIWTRYVFSPFSKDQIRNQWLLHPLIVIVDSPTARSPFHHCWPITLPIPKTHLHTRYITSARRQHIICTVHQDLATSCSCNRYRYRSWK